MSRAFPTLPADADPDTLILWAVCLMAPGLLVFGYLWWKERKK